MKNKFLFGVSSSAFQIEGDGPHSGKGESVWDRYCTIPGKIHQGENANVSCDHYHRYQEDITLMKELGVNAYRFSISWSRILPEGIGKVNQKGVEFYQNLISLLFANNIEPVITLYHWDLPQALEDIDGLLNPRFPEWFLEYTKVVLSFLDPRITKIITFNEPINVVHSSYYSGFFAPGRKVGEENTMRIIYHMQLAHGYASHHIRKMIPNAEVSLAISTFEEYPFEDTKECYEAARKRFFTKPLIGESLDAYLDPIYLGTYPKHCYERFPNVMKDITAEDMKYIAKSANVISYNNYSGYPIDQDGQEVPQTAPFYCMTGKPFNPKGIEYGIRFLTERYQLPVYISENGMACDDQVSEDNRVHDHHRVKLIEENIKVIDSMIDQGFDIRGYFVWSFTDNFEWLSGYSLRFGIVYIDYQTQQRIKKDSFAKYKEIIKTHQK